MKPSTPTSSHQFTLRNLILHRWPALIGIGLAAITPYIPFSANILLPFALGLIICAVSYPVFGSFRHQWRTRSLLALHMLVFTSIVALAYAALQLDATVGKYLLAGAFLAHTVWDIYHFRVQRIVPRWYAEACGVYDVLLAVIIIWLPVK